MRSAINWIRSVIDASCSELVGGLLRSCCLSLLISECLLLQTWTTQNTFLCWIVNITFWNPLPPLSCVALSLPRSHVSHTKDHAPSRTWYRSVLVAVRHARNVTLETSVCSHTSTYAHIQFCHLKQEISVKIVGVSVSENINPKPVDHKQRTEKVKDQMQR